MQRSAGMHGSSHRRLMKCESFINLLSKENQDYEPDPSSA